MNKNFKSITIFLTVGCFVSLFYFSFFNFLWKHLSLNYHLAVSIAYVTAILIYFCANKFLTFKHIEKSSNIVHGNTGPSLIGIQFMRFLGMVFLNYLLTLFIVHVTVSFFILQPYWGLGGAIIATTISNYILAKYWIFKS